jgi:hypothetical protein
MNRFPQPFSDLETWGAKAARFHASRGLLAEHLDYEAPPEDPHRLRLLDARAAALNQSTEHDGKQYAGNDPDNVDTFHSDPPFLG